MALKTFAPEVWFIAECFLAKSINRAERIRTDLKKAGYDKIFYFYRMDYDSLQKTIDYEPFFKFIDAIRKMK